MHRQTEGQRGHSSSKKSKQYILAAIESLEIRRLLATITVNSIADTTTPGDGAVTLREAITAINAGSTTDTDITSQNPGAFGTKDAIHFNISGTGVHTIEPASQLPMILKAVTIDGYSQSGASAAIANTAATIEIELDGEDAGTSVGLDVQGANVTIDGLAVNRFKSDGIVLEGTRSSDDVVWGNYVGISAASNTGAGSNPNVGNGGSGVLIESGASSDTVGGTSSADRNILSGNSFYGVDITSGSGGDSSGNQSDVVEGNYIGTDVTGTTAIGNNADGVLVDDVSQMTIGGTDAGAGNLISGNGNMGVELASTGEVKVEGNYIGTDVTGAKSLANALDGVYDAGGSNDVIGGTAALAGNLISGNSSNGIYAHGAEELTIQGNFIGIDHTGAKALANGAYGVVTDDESSFITIGGTDAGAGNLISGNGADGINLIDSISITVQGNKIGTDATGLVALANTTNGVQIQAGGLNDTIGGTKAAARNIISGNTGNGVQIDGATNVNIVGGTTNITVEGNYIGVGTDGSTAVANSDSGVVIDDGAQNNTIGGTDANAGNVISGNGAFGVAIDGTATATNETSGNVVEGNTIGTDVTGENGLGDGNAGVYIDLGAENNTIGGTDPGARNLISGIGGVGVYISGTHIDYSGGTGQPTITNSNTVEGNYIGTDATGTKPIMNPPAPPTTFEPFNGDGVYIDTSAYNNTIGGLTAAARNIISSNVGSGVEIVLASSNTVEGNYVGVDVTGSNALGNGNYGVEIDGGDDNIIGGTTAGAGNVISGNGKTSSLAGVEIDGSNENIVQGNHIGTDPTGSIALGNIGAGVYIEANSSHNTIGGISVAAGNVIANNGGAGVSVNQFTGSGGESGWMSVGNTIRFNSIYANTGLGIDLENDGVTVNDPQDGDAGGNNRQNYPVLVTANSTASSVTVAGTFNSLPGINFTLDFYANDTIDVHGISQGKQYIGSIGVITNSNGSATFSGTFNVAIGANKYISSTATNESTAPYGDTSEFSQSVEATPTVVTPPPPPPTPPALSINDVTLNEGNTGTTDFTFTVTRSGDTSGTSDVFYSTTPGGTATAGTDYTTIVSTPLHFAANQLTAQFTVKVNGDTTVESDETFFVTLANPTNATIADGQGTGTITNDDTAPPPPPVAKVSIITDPCDSTKTAVEIDGTNNNDTISVTKSGSAQGKVIVKINNVIKGTYSFTGSIVVHGLIGNDNISIDTAITRETFLFGELGNDTISGGGGSDVIVGGDGNDKLSGNAGRDLLFGGNGTDSLNGGADDDLLDSGTTHFDTDITSLCKLQDEWARTDKTYAQRVTDITNGGGLNGSVELNKNTTFSSTTLKDTLTGGTGNDLFFAASTGDFLSDKASGETLVKIG